MKTENMKTLLKDFWEISQKKIDLIEDNYNWKSGSPVYTRKGKYTTKG
ncbi:MAG: hypothetical protein L3J12_09395 [Spirochaetales bacterium]|nr:hypothetical protein [Spirochaetales bacterium]